MAINLQKGQRVNVGLSTVAVGLGWKPAIFGGPEPDLDASAFLVGSNGKLPQDEFFVFYNNLTSMDGSVTHTGDARAASDSQEDEEMLTVEFDKVDPRVDQIIFVVTIHDASSASQNFGQVRDAYIRVINQANNNEEIMKYELSEDFSIETAVTIGRFYRKDGAWKFEAMGMGNRGGLAEYLQTYN